MLDVEAADGATAAQSTRSSNTQALLPKVSTRRTAHALPKMPHRGDSLPAKTEYVTTGSEERER